ncbi:MAG: glycine cleavage T C-terminal barrel domain-containing protein [Planctomycetota bacterium]
MTEHNLQQDYSRLTDSAGYVRLVSHYRLRSEGKDRKQQLNGLCTADIKKMESGDVVEAFVLNEKGRVLGHAHVLNLDDHLILTGHGNQADTLIGHLDKYVIREDVRYHKETDQTAGFFVRGKQAAACLKTIFTQVPEVNQVVQQTLEMSGENRDFTVAHLELAGWGFLILTSADHVSDFEGVLGKVGIEKCSPNALDSIRIESGTPWFGLDFDDSNLPQDLQRDDKAISFTKGCYLGQETVARVDAMGRLNNLFVRFEIQDETSEPRPLKQDDKKAGRLTSVAYSPAKNSYVGLGYVKRKFKEPGTVVDGVVVNHPWDPFDQESDDPKG